MSQLEAEIAQKEGEIQRMNRQMNRVGKDVKGLDTVIETDGSDSSSSELALVNCQILVLYTFACHCIPCSRQIGT